MGRGLAPGPGHIKAVIKWIETTCLLGSHALPAKWGVRQAPHYTIFVVRCIKSDTIIAENRVIWLKSGPLRSTLSHQTIDPSGLCFPGISRNFSEIFEHVQNVTTARDSLSFRIVTDGVVECFPLHDVASSNSCNVTLAVEKASYL